MGVRINRSSYCKGNNVIKNEKEGSVLKPSISPSPMLHWILFQSSHFPIVPVFLVSASGHSAGLQRCYICNFSCSKPAEQLCPPEWRSLFLTPQTIHQSPEAWNWLPCFWTWGAIELSGENWICCKSQLFTLDLGTPRSMFSLLSGTWSCISPLFKEKLQSSYFTALPQFLLVLESLELPREPGANGDWGGGCHR